MSGRSLRIRLTLAAAGLIAIALLVSGVGLFLIFDAALDRRTADELNHTAKFLAGQVVFDPAGKLKLDGSPADPRYATPYGGLYWQVEGPGGERLRSRSLWDRDLARPSISPSELPHHKTIDLAGPDGGRLIAVVRLVRISDRTPAPLVTILVGMDRKQLEPSRATVLWLLVPSLAALGVALSLAMATFLRRALRPFRTLSEDLRGVHEGRGARLGGVYPEEVQPLVEDLNRLLGQQELALERARTLAGDMAHGLKTPLAVLGALARRTEAGHPEFSAELEEQAEAMRAQVDRALARARVAASAGLVKRRTPVAPVVEQVVSALRRLPGSERLDWRVAVADSAITPAAEGDLFEMLGAIVDNARKWGRAVVSVTAEIGSITVEDDGPGMSEPEIAGIARGKRWDEATPGAGFGLAIARDLVEATGGALTLGRSPLGGLSVRLIWP